MTFWMWLITFLPDRFPHTWTRLFQTNTDINWKFPLRVRSQNTASLVVLSTLSSFWQMHPLKKKQKREPSHTYTPPLADVKQAHIQLFDWPVLLSTCDRLCRNYFSREMKSVRMTRAGNLIHHLESLQISLTVAYIGKANNRMLNKISTCLCAFPALCCLLNRMTPGMAVAQSARILWNQQQSVSRSNPQSANLHVRYVRLNHNWYVLTKNHFHYIFHQPHPESNANNRESRNLLKDS